MVSFQGIVKGEDDLFGEKINYLNIREAVEIRDVLNEYLSKIKQK